MMCSVKHKKQLELLSNSGSWTRSDGVHCLAVKSVSMLRRAVIPALVLLAATLVAIEPSFAQRGDNPFQNPRSAWDSPQEQREVPLNSILRNLSERYGGRHLDAKKAGSRWIIAWITGDGKRLTIEVDAATGRVLSTR
jgi:hypothetical protein